MKFVQRSLLISLLVLAVFAGTNFSLAKPADHSSAESRLGNNNGGRNWFIGIGISDYDAGTGWPDLVNARSDMESVYNEFREEYEFNDRWSILLTDSLASRKNIIDTLRYLVTALHENDNLIIYYAGHGYYQPNANIGYWVPCNGNTKTCESFISNIEIRTDIMKMKAKHIAIFADCCYASAMFNDEAPEHVVKVSMIIPVGDTASSPPQKETKSTRGIDGVHVDEEMNESYYDKVDRYASREILASGRLEPVTDGDSTRSPFAASMLTYLMKADDVFSMPDLSMTLRKVPMKYQLPRYGRISGVGDEGGEFVFRRKK